MSQSSLFYESFTDAARDVLPACGGVQVVGYGIQNPIDRRDEAAVLQRQYIEPDMSLSRMSERIERLRSVA